MKVYIQPAGAHSHTQLGSLDDLQETFSFFFSMQFHFTKYLLKIYKINLHPQQGREVQQREWYRLNLFLKKQSQRHPPLIISNTILAAMPPLWPIGKKNRRGGWEKKKETTAIDMFDISLASRGCKVILGGAVGSKLASLLHPEGIRGKQKIYVQTFIIITSYRSENSAGRSK